MMALCNRIAPWATDARRIVREGGIGTLYAARALALADQTRIWQERTRDWTFRRADVGGGHLIWLGIHWLDLLLSIAGEGVAAVQALTGNVGGAPIDVEDLATVTFRYTSGAQGSLLSHHLRRLPICGDQQDCSTRLREGEDWGVPRLWRVGPFVRRPQAGPRLRAIHCGPSRGTTCLSDRVLTFLTY